MLVAMNLYRLAALAALAGCGSGAPAQPNDDGAPQPGLYAGSITDVQSCDDVCAEQSLTCDGQHDWPRLVFGPLAGGGQGGYQRPEGASTSIVYSCSDRPLETTTLDGVVYSLTSYQCACIFDETGGGGDSPCEALCANPGTGNCPDDPAPAQCIPACEQVRSGVGVNTDCLPEWDALLWCASDQPASNLECDDDGNSGVKPGVCDSEFVALDACGFVNVE